MLSKGLATVGLLLVSNVFMTLAWYAHLKLQSAKLITNWPLYTVVLFSWAIALLEYSFMVPPIESVLKATAAPSPSFSSRSFRRSSP